MFAGPAGRARLLRLALPPALALACSGVALPAGATALPRSTPTCGLAPASTVSAALGVTAKSPSTVKNGSVLVCYYPVGTNTRAVTVRFETGMNSASFAASRKGFTTSGQPTKNLAGYGSSAFTSILGSGAFTVSTVVALKGSTELLVTASASLSKVEGLAKKVLPKL